MNWYYASGGQQMGPVDEAALDDLVRSGVVRDDTLVWRQGLPGWQAHSAARPRPAAPAPLAAEAAPVRDAAPQPAPQSTAAATGGQEMRFCSNCGRPSPVREMGTVAGAAVCAACMPALTGGGGGSPQAAAQSQPSPDGGFAPAPGYAQEPYQQTPFPQQTPYPQQPSYPPAPAPYQPAGYGQPPFAQGPRYAGFWIRFLARLIDWILLAIVSAIIRFPLMLMMGGVGAGLSRSQDPIAIFAALPALASMIGLSVVIQFAVSFAYEVYFVSSRGATPGKMVLGLKIVRADGGPLSLGLAVGRYFGLMLSSFTFLIGYIIAGFDDQKRALHDRICDTRVLKL